MVGATFIRSRCRSTQPLHPAVLNAEDWFAALIAFPWRLHLHSSPCSIGDARSTAASTVRQGVSGRRQADRRKMSGVGQFTTPLRHFRRNPYATRVFGAGERTRTFMGSPPADFESAAYTIPPHRQAACECNRGRQGFHRGKADQAASCRHRPHDGYTAAA